MDKHYNISNFARRIGRSASTVRRWERDGLLKSKRLPSGHRYFDWALDVGQVATGETALVECNDAWSLGYYRDGNLPAAQYAEMLVQRWRELATAEPRRQ